MRRMLLGSIVFLGLTGAFAATTIPEVEAALDRQDYAAARAGAESILADTASRERGKAAVLLLRSLNLAGDHAALAESLDRCLEASAGDAESEASCQLEHAKSVEVNLDDKQQALGLYNELIAQYPNATFATPAALYQRGGVELALHQVDNARATYDRVINGYSTSPFVDDSLAGMAKVEAAALNPEGIKHTVSRLEEKFPSSPALQQALLTQGDFANGVSGQVRDAFFAYQKLIKANPNGIGAATARLRLADRAVGGNFDKAITEYETILQDYPNLPKSLREWALCQIGLFHWQMNRPEKAKDFLSKVLESAPANRNVAKSAQTIISAINNPQSIEKILALYDRGLRWRKAKVCVDLCWKDFLEIKELAKQPFFEDYCNNVNIDKRRTCPDALPNDHGGIYGW